MPMLLFLELENKKHSKPMVFEWLKENAVSILLTVCEKKFFFFCKYLQYVFVAFKGASKR